VSAARWRNGEGEHPRDGGSTLAPGLWFRSESPGRSDSDHPTVLDWSPGLQRWCGL